MKVGGTFYLLHNSVPCILQYRKNQRKIEKIKYILVAMAMVILPEIDDQTGQCVMCYVATIQSATVSEPTV